MWLSCMVHFGSFWQIMPYMDLLKYHMEPMKYHMDPIRYRANTLKFHGQRPVG